MTAGDDRTTIVGRAVELQLVVDHITEHGQILITGEAGVGKTAVLDAAARQLDRDGFEVVRAAGSGALVEFPLAALGHVIGDPGDRAGAALIAFATERLRALARGSRAVIVVDDAHVLDPWSLQSIAQARHAGGPRVLAAARSVSSLPDTVVAFGRHPGMRLEMQRLSAEETGDLVRGVLGDPMDTPSALRIHQATDGLPAAIVEVVRYALRRGALVRRSGLFRWDAGETGDVVDRHLAGLLGLRIDELRGDERDVVDVLAIVGELPMAVLQRIVPNADLPAMEHQRLIAASPRPHWLRIGHPLLGEAAEALLARVRHVELVRRIEGSLADCEDAELRRLAVVLAVDVGAPVDTDALLAAVEWGRAHGLWRLMLPVMERAWTEAPSPLTGLSFGEALYWTRRMAAAADVFAAAEDLCTTDRERIVISTTRARTLEIGLGRGTEAEAIRAGQLEGLTNAADRLEALCAQTERWLFDGEVQRILEVVAWAATIDGTAGADASFQAARYRLTQSSVAAFGISGQMAAMAREYELHLELSATHAAEHPLGREVVDPWWVSCNLIGGRPGDVPEMLLERYSSAVAVDDGLSRPLWALPRAIDRLLAGDLIVAEHFAREAMGVPDDVVSIRRMATHYLARVLELAGRCDEALVHARATAGDDYVGIVRSWSTGIEHRCLATSVPAPSPSVVRAAYERARSSIDDALRLGQRVTAAYVAHDLLRSKYDAELVELIEQVATSCDAPMVRWMAVHARACGEGPVAALVDVAQEAADLGFHGTARMFGDDAVDLAAARRDALAASRAAALVARCIDVTTGFSEMETSHDLAGRFGLSAREAEVMSVAATGLTDREIADELMISVRTVNAHLRAVYRKTGVTGRRSLSSLCAQGSRMDD